MLEESNGRDESAYALVEGFLTGPGPFFVAVGVGGSVGAAWSESDWPHDASVEIRRDTFVL